MSGPVVAVVQARTTSERLPGKVLLPLGGHPVLTWVATRAAMAAAVEEVVVATSTDPSDDAVEAWGRETGTTVVRGSLDDVLDRYRLAAAHAGAAVVVRLTADCPLVDPSIVDLTVATLLEGVDYCSTSLDGRYPRGLDAEAVRRDVLDLAARELTAADEREHVTLGIYRRPERFRCAPVPAPAWARHPDLRITLDEEDDYRLLQLVVDGLGTPGPRDLSSRQVVELLAARPELAATNAHVRHRTVR